MKKVVILFLISFTFLFANINKEVLYIEAKLYPKIFMLIKNLQNKKNIKVAILANKNTLNTAKILKNFLTNKNLKIKIIKNINLNYDVYIITYHINDKILNELIKHKKIIFSTSPNNINVSMFSIYIGARVYPYINPILIKKANIIIDPILFKVGKTYE